MEIWETTSAPKVQGKWPQVSKYSPTEQYITIACSVTVQTIIIFMVPSKVLLHMYHYCVFYSINSALSQTCSTMETQKHLEKQLLQFSKQVASGMNYLSSKSFVHRDLAARNILLDKSLNCKVSTVMTCIALCLNWALFWGQWLIPNRLPTLEWPETWRTRLTTLQRLK